MAERSGFFNAIKNADGVWDRKYQADDYCNNLAAIISNGVVRGSLDDLQVTANGMIVTVGTGRGWINGHWYLNDSDFTFDTVSAPTGNPRYDRVILTYDNNMEGRNIYLQYRQGTAAQNPAKPDIVRSGSVYELVLADIYVPASATSVTVEDQRSNNDICGWVYSTSGDGSFFNALDNQFDLWFDDKKDTLSTVTTEVQYKQVTLLTAEQSEINITIPQYNSSENQKIQVFVNGVLQNSPEDYSINGSVLTFASSLIASTEIIIIITVSKDGSGIPTVVDDVTELQNKVASLEQGVVSSQYNYICNGINDNVVISDLVTTFLNGGSDYSQLTINIYGTFGASAPVNGDGTSISPYRWFNAGPSESNSRRVVLDFGSCSEIELPTGESGKYYIVFFGLQASVKNCNLTVSGSDSYIYMFSTAGSAVINAENCRFFMTALSGYISRSGTFTNCRISLTTLGDNAYCFDVLSAGLLRLYSGEYYAYAYNGYTSAVVYIAANQSNAVAITDFINCPKLTRGGYVQSYAIYCLMNTNATCSFNNTITTLSMLTAGQNSTATISQNKPNLM